MTELNALGYKVKFKTAISPMMQNLILGIVVIVIVYLLYKFYQIISVGEKVAGAGYQAVSDGLSALSQAPKIVAKAVASSIVATEEVVASSIVATKETVGLAAAIPSQFISQDISPIDAPTTPLLAQSFQAGAQLGIDINQCRGTLAMSQTSEYNNLNEAQRLNYNTWACQYNKNKNIDVSNFHYAPDIKIWASTVPQVSAFGIEAIKSWLTW